MKVITIVFGVLATLAGLYMLFNALLLPGTFNMPALETVQATEVYMKAAYYALLGIGALLFALLCTASAAQSRSAQIIQQAKQPPTGAPARYDAN